jgi:molybdenum ABC transporter molybdate-binding protein
LSRSCALLSAGCADGGNEEGGVADEPLLVLAAASLSTALPVLIDRFERETGATIDLALGATGNLAAQIENGAPADLLFAADEVTVERLAAKGSIRPASVRPYAVGQLALVWRAGVEPPGGPQALGESRYEVVAIANPEIAPYGAAAREALQRLGVWHAVEPRLVQSENVAQAYQLVQTGNADVALVARSVVDTATAEFIPIDPRLHTPIRQAAGILQHSLHPAAEQFLDYVLSDAGQAVLAEHGFGRAPR